MSVFYRKAVIIYLFVFVFITSCTTNKFLVIPDEKESYEYIRLKIKYKDSKNKYNGKVLIIKKKDNKKIFLLDPLGRVHFKLIINGEYTTAIYVKKRKYWQGDFLYFIKKIWGMKLDFDNFYNLLIKGIIPETIKNKYYTDIVKNTKDEPKIVEIKDENLILRIKVLKRTKKTGIINFKTNLKKLKRVNLNGFISK
jgi:hypothetical protein